jgi:hypothetical protein
VAWRLREGPREPVRTRCPGGRPTRVGNRVCHRAIARKYGALSLEGFHPPPVLKSPRSLKSRWMAARQRESLLNREPIPRSFAAPILWADPPVDVDASK